MAMADLLSSSSSCWISASRPMAACVVSAPSSYNPPLLEINLPSLSKSRSISVGIAPLPSMGGGPRTFPGGVTKWQWKRMQNKKSQQILKARLLRERHIYEARRRAELMAATPELEMPWQKMSRVRPPNYVAADEHIKKLAARFQKNGAEDLWTERDGPETFERDDSQSSPFVGTSNASCSTTMYDEVDPFANNDLDDRKGFLKAISGSGIGGKFPTALSENRSSINNTGGAGSQDDLVSESEGFSLRKFKSRSTTKTDEAHSQWPELAEDSFRIRSAVSVNASRRNVESSRPKRWVFKDKAENKWTDTGDQFFGERSEDDSKSGTAPAMSKWKNLMDSHTNI